jgi:hypothetical protein
MPAAARRLVQRCSRPIPCSATRPSRVMGRSRRCCASREPFPDHPPSDRCSRPASAPAPRGCSPPSSRSGSRCRAPAFGARLPGRARRRRGAARPDALVAHLGRAARWPGASTALDLGRRLAQAGAQVGGERPRPRPAPARRRGQAVGRGRRSRVGPRRDARRGWCSRRHNSSSAAVATCSRPATRLHHRGEQIAAPAPTGSAGRVRGACARARAGARSLRALLPRLDAVLVPSRARPGSA